MWTRREAVTVAIAAVAEFWQHGKARAQPTSAVATLCPTGKLRVALIASNPVLVNRRPDGGLGGVSVAVGRALAANLGVPIELKSYDNPARYSESLAADDWDVGLAARDPSRAEHLVFSAAFMEVDNGYVARPGAARLIKNAEILPIPGGFEPAREALAAGKADVYGENLHLAHRIADALPGARVLPGRFNVVQMTIGVRKRSASALPTVDEFVSRIRSDGTVQKAIAEAGLRGLRVP